jgi:hypothetical protein
MSQSEMDKIMEDFYRLWCENKHLSFGELCAKFIFCDGDDIYISFYPNEIVGQNIFKALNSNVLEFRKPEKNLTTEPELEC